MGNGGCMVIDGSATTIHHNVTGGDSDSDSDSFDGTELLGTKFGLKAFSSCFIVLKLLTKESISTNNGGGGNYNDDGTIKTI